MKVGRLGMTVVASVAVGWGPAAVADSAGAPVARAATCGGSPATIVGTAHADVLRGTRGPDVIAALGGNDTLIGLRGNDRLCGGLGRDRLLGGPGDDVLRGQRDWWHVNEVGST